MELAIQGHCIICRGHILLPLRVLHWGGGWKKKELKNKPLRKLMSNPSYATNYCSMKPPWHIYPFFTNFLKIKLLKFLRKSLHSPMQMYIFQMWNFHLYSCILKIQTIFTRLIGHPIETPNLQAPLAISF